MRSGEGYKRVQATGRNWVHPGEMQSPGAAWNRNTVIRHRFWQEYSGRYVGNSMKGAGEIQ